MSMIHPRYALFLALAPVLGCPDDSDSVDEDTSSTSDVASTSTSRDDSSGASVETSSSSGAAETSSGGDGSSSSGGPDPFAACSRDVLEDDFAVFSPTGMPEAARWYGPGADPETGELLDDGTGEYVVTATYLALEPDADFELFGQLSAANSMALFSNPGMVATQLGNSQQCATARTFTVWESQAAMMEFVGSKAHLQSVGAFPSLSRGGSTLSVWPGMASASEITWDTALANMAEADAYD